MKEYKFEDIVLKKVGFLRGPFGGDLKKEIFVPKGEDTYKVYEQGVVLQRDSTIGKYYISKDYFDNSMSRFEVKTNDFLVSCSGVNYGAIHQLKGQIEKGVINQALLRVRLNNEIIDDNYFLYLFRIYIVNMIIGKKGDSTIPNFPPLSVIKNLKFELPELPVQKKIGKILHSLDTKIELNNKINQELEAMAKLLYDYWFVQFDFPNEQGKPYKSSGGKMVYNKDLKREIPEGWEVKKLSNIANITMGQSPSGSSYNEEGRGKIFFQGSTDFGWRFPTIRQYTTEPSRMAKVGDILLSVRAPVGTLNIADYDCCIGRGLAALNSKDGATSYLFYVMIYFKQVFDRRNSAGTTFGAITKDDLYSLQLVYPDKKLLKQFDTIVSKYNEKILNNYKQNQQLIKLRDWLLPMLMNGQVTVGEAEEQLNMAAEPQTEYGKVINANFAERECNTSERAILAAYIVKMVGYNDIGKTKLMKLLHLTEYICQIKLGSHYVKKTAGPYDEGMIDDIHRFFQQYNLFKIKKDKKGSFSEIHYIPSFEFGQIEERFLEIYSSEVVRVNDLLNRMKGWKLKHCEILSTLYAVWNNRIKRNQSTEKHLLKKDFFEWSNRKKEVFTENEVDKSIDWMKRKNIVPTGWGDFVEEIA